MALSRFHFGWTVTTGSNDKINFKTNGSAEKTATLDAGVYTPGELAAEAQAELRETDGSSNIGCTYNALTGKFVFTWAGAGNLELLWGTGTNAAADANALFGFAAADESHATSITSDDAARDPANLSGSSSAYMWTMDDPLATNTPVTATGTDNSYAVATFTQREVFANQNVTEGGLVETIYKGQIRKVTLRFWALQSDDRTSMETFLDWILQGRRFFWQPDSASANGLRLVMANPREVLNAFEWLTRSEQTYGDITFYEQASR